MKMHKQYRLRTIKNPDGEIRWIIEMDEDFIVPVKDEVIQTLSKTLPLGDIVTSRAQWNFGLLELGSVLDQIERVIREAGLRKVRMR